MKTRYALPLVCLAAATRGLPQTTDTSRASAERTVAHAPAAIGTITAHDLEGFVRTLASDELGGRLTGTPGQIAAARLFADEFAKLGLRPLGDERQGKERSYLQAYPVRLDGLEAATSGLFDADGKKLNDHGAWFVPRKDPIEVAGQLVFADRRKVADLDLDGKIVVMPLHFRKTRGGGIYRAMGEGMRQLGRVRDHARRALTAHAKACVLVAPSFPRSFLSVVNMFGVYPGKPRVTRRGRGRRMGMPRSAAPKLPTLAVTGADAAAVLAALGLAPDDVFAQKEGLAGKSKGTFTLRARRFRKDTEAFNTCAYLPGSDPELAAEAILYSCHMDHLGRAADGGCFYGADDNGSGCSGVLEIAGAYASLPAGDRPKRSVVFLAVSGEEEGLWGSDHFTRHPTWPLDKIAADINMDMIGRSTRRVPKDMVAVTPTHANKAYSTLAREAAWLGQGFGLRMGNGDRFYTRSDHYNFARRGIPVVFFCDDEHPDYHMPSDTWQKLEFDKMEKIARLAFLVGYRTADAAERPSRLGRRADWFTGSGEK